MPILGLKAPGPSKPAHFSLEPLIRPNILSLQPYRCARDDYSEGILLDANENAMGTALPKELNPVAAQTMDLLDDPNGLNRYPSPTHDDLKRKIAKFRGVPNEDWVFLGVGSDEVIDLLFRVLCVPGKDRVMTTPPTYGMYGVTAQVNDVEVVKVPLDENFQLDEEKMLSVGDVKLLFVCSPGNPTGTLIPIDAMRRILDNPKFTGVMVVDEAYIDFTPEGSAASLVNEYANVCVMQTLSKSFGLAAIRLGYLLAPPPLIQILTNTKAPYNISLPTASLALSAVSDAGLENMAGVVATLNENRRRLAAQLGSLPRIGRIRGGNHANFLLVEVLNTLGQPDSAVAQEVYKTLADRRGVVVRFRGNEPGCVGCLRVTVGTEKECEALVERLAEVLI